MAARRGAARKVASCQGSAAVRARACARDAAALRWATICSTILATCRSSQKPCCSAGVPAMGTSLYRGGCAADDALADEPDPGGKAN